MIDQNIINLNNLIHKYDGLGVNEGSSSLWSSRIIKAFGYNEIHHNKSIANTNVIRFKIFFYFRFLNFNQLLDLSAKKIPLASDIKIFKSVEQTNGFLSMPDDDDPVQEMDHSIVIHEYDKSTGLFKIDTGWEDWGDKGIGYLPKEYIENHNSDSFLWISNKKSILTIKRHKYLINKLHLYFELYYLNFKKLGKIYILNIRNKSGDIIGWTHVKIDKKSLDLLDIFVVNEYRRNGIATKMMQYLKNHFKINNISGYISGFDLINNNEDIVTNFLMKNNLNVYPATHSFSKNIKYKIISLLQ